MIVFEEALILSEKEDVFSAHFCVCNLGFSCALLSLCSQTNPCGTTSWTEPGKIALLLSVVPEKFFLRSEPALAKAFPIWASSQAVLII